MLAVSWDTIRLFPYVLAAAIWAGGQLVFGALTALAALYLGVLLAGCAPATGDRQAIVESGLHTGRPDGSQAMCCSWSSSIRRGGRDVR
ncbi:MAG: hypothetical protein ACRDOB_05160 [Streptosporangiaceae bacterium]